MGLSRNKVAVPEGAAGTPPFWRILQSDLKEYAKTLVHPVLPVLTLTVIYICIEIFDILTPDKNCRKEESNFI